MTRARLLEQVCADCGNAVPDADYHDPDGVENVTGIPICQCNLRPRALTGYER